MKKSSISLLLVLAVTLTGCASGNIHEFLTNPAANSSMPLVTSIGKLFYPERYSVTNISKTVPNSFANKVPDRVDQYVFLGFTANDKNDMFTANYYDPTSIKNKNGQFYVTTYEYTSRPGEAISKPGNFFSSSITKQSINCAENLFTRLEVTAYPQVKPSGSGTVLFKDSPKNKPVLFNYEQDSIQARLAKKVCSN